MKPNRDRGETAGRGPAIAPARRPAIVPARRRRSVPALCAGVALAAASSLASAPAHATGDPDLTWFTIETDHFRIHYPSDLEPIATRIARVAETAHERLKGPLGYAPSSRTEVIVTDDSESANGSATALPYNTVTLYATSPDDFSPLNDYDDWYLSLVTHEYTHILHVDNITGVASIINAILGKTYSPNQSQPRWIIEGLAVLSESAYTSGGRLRSSIFDMYMRADVLEDNIAGLDQMCSAPQRWPQGSLWYLYGSRFLSWIASTYGSNVLRAVSQDYGGSTIPLGINRAIKRQTGRTYVELFEGFKDQLKRQYKEQMRGVEKRGFREGKPLTAHGNFVYYPRFVPRSARAGEGEEIVYYRDDFDQRTGLYKIPLALPAGEKERPSELIARTRGSTAASFTGAGDLYFTSNAVWKNLYDRDDIFFLPRGQRAASGDEPYRKRLTTGQRTALVDASPDGKQVVFTVNTRGTTFLEVADVAADGSLQNRRDLVPSLRFEQIYTPRFSPDGKLVAYSHWRTGGYRDVRIVEVATGKIRAVTDDRALDMQPEFSPDQKTLYFVSDRTGIPNVYAYDLAGGALKQVTNVHTGAFSPAISSDGKTLAYQGYSSRGFDIFAMPLEPAKFLEALPAPNDRPDPLPATSAPLHFTKRPYDPFPTLRPHNYFLELAPGKYGNNAVTFTASGSDIAGLHSFGLRVTVDPQAPSPDFSLSYNYNRLPFNFGVRGFYSTSPRSNYRIGDQDVTYDERALGITTGISLPIYDEFSRQSLGLSFSAANYSGELPVGTKIDPYAAITRKPPQGNINVVHLGYSFSNVEGGLRTPGASRGVSLNLGVDFGGQPTGSNFGTYAFEASVTGYLPMPWLKYHTLALHAEGGVSGGGYPRGNTYYVGGYNLERHDLPDTILSGVFNGAFVLRGYSPSAFGGKEYLLANAEYRFPILVPDRGVSTLPVYLRRIDGNLLMDIGGAFNDFNIERARFFRNDRFLDTTLLHAAAGAELWFGVTFFYALNAQLRLGYARGLSGNALRYGQWYFVASTAY
jgi:hypothetical protein